MDDIYLLPEILLDFLLEPGPIEVLNFAIYAFAKRLDSFGYSFHVATISRPGQKCYLYQHKLPNEILETMRGRFLIESTINGKVLYLNFSTFQVICSKDIGVPIHDGYWPSVSLRYQQIGALYHLGIIPPLSPQLFKAHEEQITKWTNLLHKKYETHGSLNSTLQLLFNRVIFSLYFFSFPSSLISELSKKKTNFLL